MNLFPPLTPDIEARLIRVARQRRHERRKAWRNAVREALKARIFNHEHHIKNQSR